MLSQHAPQRAVIAHAAFFFVFCSLLFTLLTVQPRQVAFAVEAEKEFDTVGEFNEGNQFHTGLTEDTVGGGDGDGEVRLLNIGINPATWNKGTGNNTGLPARWGHKAVQYKGKIYVSGGNTSPLASTGLNTVTYSTIQPNHNLSNWSQTTALPAKRFFHGMAVLNNYIYVIGGLDDTATQQATVFKAVVNQDGTLGPWTTTTPLPQSLSDFGTAVFNGSIYIVGGDHNGFSVSTVYSATPDGAGNIAAWNPANSLPVEISRQAIAQTDQQIYLAGGARFTNSVSEFLPNVYYGTGSTAWNASVPLPVNLVYAAGVAYGGQLYIVGGAFNNGANLENNIRSTLLNMNGSVAGSWQSSNVLSAPRQRSAAVLSDDGWIYAIQGQSGDLQSGGVALATIDYGPTVAAGGDAFAESGVYTSPTVDLGESRPISSIIFNTSLPADTGMSFEYRASDFSNFSDTTFQSAGSAAIGNDVNTTKLLSLTKRYIQFRANLSSNPLQTKSPVLNRVTIHYDAPATDTPTPSPTQTTSGTATHTPTSTTTATATSTLTGTPTRTSSPTPTTTATVTNTPCQGTPARAQPVSPNNASNIKPRRVPLGWDPATCAETYRVIVRMDSKRGPKVFKKKNITATQVTTKRLQKGHLYFWRVKACNTTGCAKASAVWKFRISGKGNIIDAGPADELQE